MTWLRASHISYLNNKMSMFDALNCPRISQSTTGAILNELKSVFNDNEVVTTFKTTSKTTLATVAGKVITYHHPL